MMSEFIDRTGFEPTAEEYDKIEEAYYKFEGDKDAFCRQFVEQDGVKKICVSRAEKIAQLKSQIIEMEKDFMRAFQRKEREVELLEAQLEREQEWVAYESHENVKQSEYDKLRDSGCTKVLGEEDAIDLIASEFGFDPGKIAIIYEVPKYEINRHGRLRRVDTIERKPLYSATDWNYIRFNVHGNVTMCYELHDGALKLCVD